MRNNCLVRIHVAGLISSCLELQRAGITEPYERTQRWNQFRLSADQNSQICKGSGRILQRAVPTATKAESQLCWRLLAFGLLVVLGASSTDVGFLDTLLCKLSCTPPFKDEPRQGSRPRG